MHGPLLTLALLGSPNGCPPIALLRGTQALVTAVQAELERRGVKATSRAGCSALSIALETKGPELAVMIDAVGVAQTAPDAASAATIIESWARTEITDPLLEREEEPEDRRPIAAAAESRAPEERPAVEQERIPPIPRTFALSVGGVLGVGNDRSNWAGVDLRGCVQLWRLCFGARFQYARDLGESGDVERLDGDRYLLDFGATIDLPLVFGDIELVPGLAVGMATVQARREYAGLIVDEDAAGFRARAQLGFIWRFARHWSLRFDFAIDVAPAARREILGDLGADGPEIVPLAGEVPVMFWLRGGLEAGGT